MDKRTLDLMVENDRQRLQIIMDYLEANNTDENPSFHIDYIAKNILQLNDEEMIEYKQKILKNL
jgi:hypothetical protein